MSGKHFQPSKSRKREQQERYINSALQMWFDDNGEEEFTTRTLMSLFIENKDKYKSSFKGIKTLRNIPTVYVVSRYISTLPYISKVCDSKSLWKIDGDKYVMDRKV